MATPHPKIEQGHSTMAIVSRPEMSVEARSLNRSGAVRKSTKRYGSVKGKPSPSEHSVDVGSGPKETDHLVKIRREVDEVKDIMKDNIDKVVERDGKITDLGERADVLKTHTNGFKENAKAVRKNAQRKNWKITCCIATLVIVVLGVITLIILYALKIL